MQRNKYSINDFSEFKELEKALEETELCIKRIDEIKQSKLIQSIDNNNTGSDFSTDSLDASDHISANYSSLGRRGGSRYSRYSNSNYRNRSRSKSPGYHSTRSKSPQVTRHVRFTNYSENNNSTQTPCHFYFINGHCRKGASCNMSHDRTSLKDNNRQ